jgi:ELWxxDGT repeat protein
MRSRSLPCAVLTIAFLGLAVPAVAQPAFQVRDLCTTSAPLRVTTPPFNGEGAEGAGGIAVLPIDDGVNGLELWRSDSTEAGTFLLRDVCAGICASLPRRPFLFDGALYFLASSRGGQTTFPELWKTDGTRAGTEEVIALHVRDLTALPDRLLLFAFPEQGPGEGLWMSDGTAAGTSEVIGVSSGAFMGRAGGIAFFSAYDSHGIELWRTDGTAAGTFLVKDIHAGPDHGVLSFVRYPGVDGRLFFAGFPQAIAHAELWVSDGTTAGTYSLHSLRPEIPPIVAESLVARSHDVFFLAGEDESSRELWKTDGTADGTLRLSGGVATYQSAPSLAVVGDEVFFPALNGELGHELWKSDGTVAGTVPVADIAAGSASSVQPGDAPLFAVAGSKLLLYADDVFHGYEPWASDGTAAGTSLLADIDPGSASSFPDVGFYGRGAVAGGAWYFGAYTAPEGWSLWTSDGTAPGTRAVHPFLPQTSSSPLFFANGSRTLIAADPLDGKGRQLWSTDGSGPGTRRVRLPGGVALSHIDSFARLGNRVAVAGDSLWLTDGTSAGARVVTAAPPYPRNAIASAGQVFFTDPGGALWRTDGTNPGTRRINPNPPGYSLLLSAIRDGVAFLHLPSNGSPSQIWVSNGTTAGTRAVKPQLYNYWLARVDDRFFFLTLSPQSGESALWVSDGTTKGTRAVTVLPVFPPSFLEGGADPAVAWRGRLYFIGNDGVHGRELWVSDGTRAGTRQVTDLRPGSETPEIRELTAGADRLYFSADDGLHGRELWKSDGTKAGTRMVRDLIPGPGSSFPQKLAAVDHALLFAATDEEHGLELWTTDGTAARTRLVQDIAPGSLPSSPHGFTAGGPFVYFSATDAVTGFEPWAVPRSALGDH